MRTPAECYVPSMRPYTGLPELEYPFHDKTVTVTTCGRICFNRQKINLSVVFAGQSVGIKQVSEEIWLVTFMDYDLGYFDHETCRLESLDNPFGPIVLHPNPGFQHRALTVERYEAWLEEHRYLNMDLHVAEDIADLPC